jgi:gliding motility-associated-like protein
MTQVYLKLTIALTFLLTTSLSIGQTLIINEVSQGETGTMEYAEFVVVDTAVSYNCSSSTPPCIDIRGWIIDDNSGYHGTSGVASGANRFSNDPIWSCVPLGTIILVYNNGQTNPEIPADDLLLNDGNCKIVTPINNYLFESNSTTPGAVACSYPPNGWTANGNWLNISMANGGDCMRIVNLNGCEVFSVCYGSNDQNILIYFPGSGQDKLHYFNSGDPTNQSNWSAGCADLANCGSQDQTPGSPNNIQNSNYIAQFNNNCSPITPLATNAFEQAPSDCGCTGEAIVSASGSIPGYTFEWFDDNNVSLNYYSDLATGLCAGDYYVVVESSIGCLDTATVTINSSSSGGVSDITDPNNETASCSILNADVFIDVSDLISAGSVITGDQGALDVTSFQMLTETQTGFNCPEEWTRTYTVADTCGNSFSVDHLILVDDLLAPTGIAPNDTTVVCISDIPAININDVTGVSDNCSSNPLVEHVSDVTLGSECVDLEVIRTYSITDDCGNTSIVNQSIIIEATYSDSAVEGTNPSDCISSDGSILITGLLSNTDYDLGYNGLTSFPITTNSFGEFELTGLSGGNYSDFILSLTSCLSCETNLDTLIILLEPGTPQVDAGSDLTICEGESVTLSAYNPDSAIIDWNNAVDNNQEFEPAVGSISYTVTALLNGCISNDEVVVTVNELPEVEAGNNMIVCSGDEVTLTATGADTYSWNNSVVNGSPFFPSESGEFMVEGTSNGCSSTDSLEITVIDDIIFDFQSNIQSACELEDVEFSAQSNYADAQYSWSFGDGETGIGEIVTHSYQGGNCYDVSLTITLPTGCSETILKEDVICMSSKPNASFIYSPDYISEFSNEINFTNTSNNASSYFWDFGMDSIFSTEENPTQMFYDFSKDYYTIELVAFNDLGCSDTAIQILKVEEELIYYIPNSFTPDEDQVNPTFKPIFTSGFDINSYQIEIFNRWGELIFSSKDVNEGWNGTLRSGQKAKDGTYVWKISFATTKNSERFSKVDHVNLLR